MDSSIVTSAADPIKMVQREKILNFFPGMICQQAERCNTRGLKKPRKKKGQKLS